MERGQRIWNKEIFFKNQKKDKSKLFFNRNNTNPNRNKNIQIIKLNDENPERKIKKSLPLNFDVNLSNWLNKNPKKKINNLVKKCANRTNNLKDHLFQENFFPTVKFNKKSQSCDIKKSNKPKNRTYFFRDYIKSIFKIKNLEFIKNIDIFHLDEKNDKNDFFQNNKKKSKLYRNLIIEYREEGLLYAEEIYNEKFLKYLENKKKYENKQMEKKNKYLINKINLEKEKKKNTEYIEKLKNQEFIIKNLEKELSFKNEKIFFLNKKKEEEKLIFNQEKKLFIEEKKFFLKNKYSNTGKIFNQKNENQNEKRIVFDYNIDKNIEKNFVKYIIRQIHITNREKKDLYKKYLENWKNFIIYFHKNFKINIHFTKKNKCENNLKKLKKI